MHTIAAVGTAGVAAADRLSNRKLDNGVNTDNAAVGGLRLEHKTDAAVALNVEKRSPESDISLKAVGMSGGVTTKDNVMTKPMAF